MIYVREWLVLAYKVPYTTMSSDEKNRAYWCFAKLPISTFQYGLIILQLAILFC